MATQLTVIRGDRLGNQTLNISSSTDDFSDITCSGHLRAHPDGHLLHEFEPIVFSAGTGAAIVHFDLEGSVTKNLPPINLYGDVHFYSTGIFNKTLFEFRLNVLPDVTHI